ncbi:hypothetical protein ACFFWC_29675 [Plantactinospora siamensis]|uniref:HTH cro/C1-type domain-containing protein n=1 Tax=Plantactinospora siamensis TaxID=555372 RepID=A0ABV6NP96_9ACTN
MASERVGKDMSPGEVVRQRLRDIRRRRKLSSAQAAEMFDDPAMSATVLMSIEAGRRQTGATVDELIRFAYILDVPPAALLVTDDGAVQVAPGVVVDPARFRRWVLGQEALDGTNTALYKAAADQLASTTTSASPELREEFLARAQVAFDSFVADSEEIRRKTRQQVRGVLTDIREAATSGADTETLVGKIDDFLSRLE